MTTATSLCSPYPALDPLVAATIGAVTEVVSLSGGDTGSPCPSRQSQTATRLVSYPTPERTLDLMQTVNDKPFTAWVPCVVRVQLRTLILPRPIPLSPKDDSFLGVSL